ncbi:nucleoside phosphorylase domain-containing protein [Aspergillus terricola var. indicus]
MKRRHPRAEDFTVGWICPLALEYAAAKSVLDELYEEAENATGRIHHNDIVITCLPAGQMRTIAAAAATERMRVAFPSLKHALLVGIAGGVPSDKADIRLGDVVVGQPDGQYAGVVQYVFGKMLPGGFQRIGHVGLTGDPRRDYRYLLWYHCFGNQVIKDGVTRDTSSSKLGGILCFEMEAAGVVNLMPCLVIRGICDYADFHKNKVFQPFAAAAAAACARGFLSYLPRALCERLDDGQMPVHGQIQQEAQDRRELSMNQYASKAPAPHLATKDR